MSRSRDVDALAARNPGFDGRTAAELSAAEERVKLARSQFEQQLQQAARATRGAVGGAVRMAGLGALLLVAGLGVRAWLRARKRRHESFTVRISFEPAPPPRPGVLPALAEGALHLMLARLAQGAVQTGEEEGSPSAGVLGPALSRGAHRRDSLSTASASVV